MARAASAALLGFARGDSRPPRPTFIGQINDTPALQHPFATSLEEAGFVRAGTGLHLARGSRTSPDSADPGDAWPDEDEE